jgi:hypothetical protein
MRRGILQAVVLSARSRSILVIAALGEARPPGS